MASPAAKAAGRAAVESAGAAALGVFALRGLPLPAAQGRWAALGVLAAWGVCTVSTVVLAIGQGGGSRGFWLSFSAGVAMRITVLLGLMRYVWVRPQVPAAALLGGFVFGLAALMLLEFRHFARRTQ